MIHYFTTNDDLRLSLTSLLIKHIITTGDYLSSLLLILIQNFHFQIQQMLRDHNHHHRSKERPLLIYYYNCQMAVLCRYNYHTNYKHFLILQKNTPLHAEIQQIPIMYSHHLQHMNQHKMCIYFVSCQQLSYLLQQKNQEKSSEVLFVLRSIMVKMP